MSEVSRPDADTVFPHYEHYMDARKQRGKNEPRLDREQLRQRWSELDDDTANAAAQRFSTEYDKLEQAGRDAVARILKQE